MCRVCSTCNQVAAYVYIDAEPDVISKFAKDGFRLVQRMLNRHAGYKNLPCPLRGKALERRAVAEGLVPRARIVKVDARTVREEVNMAEGWRKMNMPEEVGKRCNHVVMLKTKRIQCVQAIKAQAIAAGDVVVRPDQAHVYLFAYQPEPETEWARRNSLQLF